MEEHNHVLKHVKVKDNIITDLMSRMSTSCNEDSLFSDDMLCSEVLHDKNMQLNELHLEIF